MQIPPFLHPAFFSRPGMAAIISSTQASRGSDTLPEQPSILLQAVIVPAERVAEGQLVAAVTIPWFEILALIQRSPETIYDIGWRKWEEIVAGAYSQQGFEVILTPRSNDKGRDVIATMKGLGSIRIVDQVKAYRPGHVVTADEVRSMVGVLTLNPNVSKGLVTTTSSFAPGVLTDADIARLRPYRLELKDGAALLEWLRNTAAANPKP
jgi:restriction system protein